MIDLPDPLTPADADLRGMPYMPLDLVTLFDSDLYVLSTGDEFKAALTLWGKSFHQLPAGSLPDDERLLEHLSGAKRWKAVRDMALRGWIKCSDGRLYHRKVAEKVAESWGKRVAFRQRTEAARAARHKDAAQSDTAKQQSVATPVTSSVTENVTTPVTGSKGSDKDKEGNIEKEEANASSQKPDRAQLDLAPPGPPKPGIEAEFEIWWKAYPARIGSSGKAVKPGKPAALALFRAARKKAALDALLAATRRYAAATEARYVVDPERWLKREKWLDEVAEAPAGKRPPDDTGMVVW